MIGVEVAETFLGRVLRSEVDTSSLLAYCAALDPEPLQRFLELPAPITGLRVEVQHTGRSRLDVVVDGTSGVLAVLELKVSATEHGDQLTRYEGYAAPDDAALFLLDLELPGATRPTSWTRKNLADVFGCWSESSDASARGFAAPISAIFRRWMTTAQGPFENIDSAMLSIVMRSVAAALESSGFDAQSAGTAVGKPALMAFAPHPSGIENAFLCVDVRCQDQNDPSRPWLFRLGIHVDAPDTAEDLGAARSLAHRLALELEPALSLDALLSHLVPVSSAVAGSVSTIGPLKSPRNREAAIAGWLEAAENERTAPAHPIFFHDWGRRLAARFLIDLSKLTPNDLELAVSSAMDFLAHAAVTSAREPLELR